MQGRIHIVCHFSGNICRNFLFISCLKGGKAAELSEQQSFALRSYPIHFIQDGTGLCFGTQLAVIGNGHPVHFILHAGQKEKQRRILGNIKRAAISIHQCTGRMLVILDQAQHPDRIL